MKQRSTLKKNKSWRNIGKKLFILLTCTVMMMPCLGFAQTVKMADIQEHWAKEQINEWVDKQWIAGYPDGTFRPNHPIKRAEFITLINQSFHFTEYLTPSFYDVKETDWYYYEIGKALKAGYISGYEDNTIKPMQSICRQEVAVIITKLLALDISSSPEEINKFKDQEDIPDWCKKEVNAVVKNRYMKGYPDGAFMPEKPMTRAEAIVVLDSVLKSLENVADQQKLDPLEIDEDMTDESDDRSGGGSSSDGREHDHDDDSDNDDTPVQGPTAKEMVERIKEDLALVVKDAKGQKKIPTIELLHTDQFGYGSEITWESSNPDYITIDGEKATIFRRGNQLKGQPGGDDHHILTFAAMEDISTYCSDNDQDHDTGGCSGDGGKKTIVTLTATIKKENVLNIKIFPVNIHWGWGKSITIGEKDEEDDSTHIQPPVGHAVDQTLYMGQYPLLLTAEDLASYGETVTEAVYEIVYGQEGSIRLDILEDGRLQVIPKEVGKVNITAYVTNKLAEEEVNFDSIIRLPKKLDDYEAVSEVQENLKLSVYSKGHGPTQINKISLPNTDRLGLGTEITWETDNDEFMKIEKGEALIHRRGNNKDSGCGGDDHQHIVSFMSMDDNCSDEDDSHDCGGSSDKGGRSTVVKLRATIERGDQRAEKDFIITIPWGWGRKITMKH